MIDIGTPYFIVLCFNVLNKCCVFYKLQERPSLAKIFQLTLLLYSLYYNGLEPNLQGMPVAVMWKAHLWWITIYYTKERI